MQDFCWNYRISEIQKIPNYLPDRYENLPPPPCAKKPIFLYEPLAIAGSKGIWGFIIYSLSFQTITGLFLNFFLKIFLRNRYTVYANHSKKKIANATIVFVSDLLAKPNKNSNGAIMTIAGKFERIYRLDVGVRKPGSISFIKIIPLEAVPVKVP